MWVLVGGEDRTDSSAVSTQMDVVERTACVAAGNWVGFCWLGPQTGGKARALTCMDLS